MKSLTSIVAAVAASLSFASMAEAADKAVVDLYVKGAGTMRFEAPGTSTLGKPVAETCGGVPGSSLPEANLANPSDNVQYLCRQEFALTGCPSGGPDCTLKATIRARRPNVPQLTLAEARTTPAHWFWSGWSRGTVCEGEDTLVCEVTYGSCTGGTCTYVAPFGVTAEFRDQRPPAATFRCRTASGVHDNSEGCVARPPRLVTHPDGVATFRIRSNEYSAKEHSRLECQLDGEGVAWSPCAPAPAGEPPGTVRLAGVEDGPHSLRIRAVDPSGNVQTAAVEEARWTQRYPPVTIVLSGPPDGSAINTRRPEFRFAPPPEDTTRECRFDDHAWKPCTVSFSPERSLTDGAHAFSVRSTRTVPEGSIPEVDPPVRRFVVDLGAPQPVITSGPEEGLVTTNRTAVFRFETDPPEPQVTFECSLDGTVPTPCGTGVATYESLSAGRHTLTLTAIDAAGNPGVLTRTWTVIADADRDGFYAPDNDCDDANPAVRPGATEVPGNGVDENCDGVDPPNLDADRDGELARPQGRDCNDADAAIRPGAHEVLGNGVDEDCDGVDPPDLDRDRDGVLTGPLGRDCDDGDPAIHPGAEDVPENGVDEDCDEVDAAFPLVGVRFEARWQPFRTYTRLVSLHVLRVPAGATVTIVCKRGCKRRTRRIDVRRARDRMSLARYVRRRLPIGTRLEVRVSKVGTSTQGRRWRMRRRAAPAVASFCVRGGHSGPC